jgi:ketosteroid isomerase-like protein
VETRTHFKKRGVSEKPLKLTSYHYMQFKDGKVVSGGDYFDATGMMAVVQSKDTVTSTK